MTLYGMPYQGSKSRLVAKILDVIPSADNFYDLFAGGCSVTHYALLSGKYKNVYCNDNDEFVIGGFVKAIGGKFHGETRFVDKAEFDHKHRRDQYISCCFSFGNNWRTYAYGRDIEDYKRQYHNAVFYGEKTGMLKYGIDLKHLDFKDTTMADRYERVQSEIRKQTSTPDTIHLALPHYSAYTRLLRLANLPTPIITTSDYRGVLIEPNSVVYCDIPYKGTGTYNKTKFDHDAFYEWCGKQEQLTFISEYEMPENFIKVASFKHRTIFGPVPKCMHPVDECLFIPKHQYDLLTDHLKYMVEVTNKH